MKILFEFESLFNSFFLSCRKCHCLNPLSARCSTKSKLRRTMNCFFQVMFTVIQTLFNHRRSKYILTFKSQASHMCVSVSHTYVIGHYNSLARIKTQLLTSLILCALILYINGGEEVAEKIFHMMMSDLGFELRPQVL